MTTPPDAVERKVRQLDNDVQAIYTMLVGIEVNQRRHDNRFEEIGSDIGQLKTDVSGLKTDVSGLKGDVAALDAKLDRVLALLER